MILSYSFSILTSIGLWKPVHWKSPWRVILYGFLSLSYATILYVDTSLQAIYISQISSNVSDYAYRSLILPSMFGACFKVVNILKNRHRILALMKRLESSNFKIRNSEEEEIFKESDQITKVRICGAAIFVQLIALNLILRSVISLAPLRIDMSKLQVPWKNLTVYGFWISFVLQAINRWCYGLVHIGWDSLVVGLMLCISVQFRVLRVRLMELSTPVNVGKARNANIEKTEEQKISELIEHHLDIIQIVSELNDIFNFIIFVQYLISSYVLCVTVFVLAQIKHFDSYTALVVIYMGCLLYEVYILCSTGSEMTFESDLFSTHIYTSNWEDMKMSTKKSLLIMMMRSHIPLKFTSMNLIELSMASFSQIVRFSYSAFNVLSQKK